ncbi:MAG: hypothetical protein JWM96_1345 [Alphaproteobacteria bacterium]|nr:hypothetical protein [Alphaproteobacteria bacterium]
MTATPINLNMPEPVVVVNNGVLYINNLTENDPTVVAAVDVAENQAAEAQRLLRLGAQVDRLAGATLDAEVLEGTALRLVTSFEGTVDSAVDEIQKNAAKIFDPQGGSLPTALGGFKAELDKLLGLNFDPDSRKSIIGKFDELMRNVSAEQMAKFSRLLDPTATDSPLNKWHADIDKTVKAEAHTLSEQLRELSERIAVQNATAEAKKAAANKTTAKGFTFEDTLHALVEQNALPHQDLAVQTGRTLGSCGNQQGDELVTLNPEDTRGAEANVVFECKDKKMGLKKILDELDGAMKNRDAAVGVAVFATTENAPTNVAFSTYGCKAVLVLDKDDPDPLAVRLAYMWARWVAKRELVSDTNEIDAARIESLIDEARRALQRATTVKKCHTSARKGIDEATAHVDALVGEIVAVLDDLHAEVTKAA